TITRSVPRAAGPRSATTAMSAKHPLVRMRVFWGDKSPGERSDGIAGQGPLRGSAQCGDALLGRVAAELARHVGHAVRRQAAAAMSAEVRVTSGITPIALLLHELPAKTAVLDGELVAGDADGRPNFARLHLRWTWPGAIHLWAFDLLAFNGPDLRLQPLVKRQARLQALMERFRCPTVS